MVDNGAIGGSQSNPAVSGLSTTSSSSSSSSGTYTPPPAPPPQTTTQVIIGVGPQTFRVTCTGMKPNTLHKAYLLTKDVSINCAPISNTQPYTMGANLVTDSTGYLQFDYAFTPTNSPFQTQFVSAANQTIAIIPVGNQTFKVSSVDGTSHAESYIISKGTISA